MDEPNKCIYCGSPYVGGGCLFNPYGKMHVRGPEFLNRSSVVAEKALLLKYMLDKVSEKEQLVEHQTYKSPLDRFYKKMVNIIASITEPLFEAFNLRELPTHTKLSKENLIKSYQFKQKFKSKLEELSKLVAEANLQLPPELVEESLIYAIINSDGHKN
jgi:lambda repressor-like predicted transcriptional regulator